MMKVLANHEAKDLNVTVYKQIWNEPDLTSYFNYSAGGTTFFHGTNADYNSMYESASTAMAVGFWLKSYKLDNSRPKRPTLYYIQRVSSHWSLCKLLS